MTVGEYNQHLPDKKNDKHMLVERAHEQFPQDQYPQAHFPQNQYPQAHYPQPRGGVILIG